MADKTYGISRVGRLRMGSDGHGVRSLIIVPGCPLRCKQCINSFTWNENDIVGTYSAKELYGKICIDRPYILATNGGITFGGGEPLQYPQLIKDMRAVADKYMTINIETCLNVPRDNLINVLDYVDEFIVDIKTMDKQIYHEYTGGNLIPVLDNLQALVETGHINDVLIRIPIIPEYTDHESQQKSKDELQEMGFKRFDLFTYKKETDIAQNKTCI